MTAIGRLYKNLTAMMPSGTCRKGRSHVKTGKQITMEHILAILLPISSGTLVSLVILFSQVYSIVVDVLTFSIEVFLFRVNLTRSVM